MSRNPQLFMEPEGSLLHSQNHATGPFTEPDQSSPCHPSHVLMICLNIILPLKPRSSKWCLSLRCPRQNPVCTFPVSFTCVSRDRLFITKYRSADKSLARPGRKQTIKLGIYSTYSPRNSIHFLARCCNFCKPLKKRSEGFPSNQVSAAAMTFG